MPFDFDHVPDRRGSGSLKWEVGENELPMWVADMDFPTCPSVQQAILARAAHGVFGYTDVTEDWRRAVCGWFTRRHGFAPDPEWLIFSTGVVPILSSAVRKLTTPNENVLLLTPVYNVFYNSIVNNGCRPLEVPLLYRAGEYQIDFPALERGLADPQTSLMILCNPHNPIGKIWDRETLARIGSLAAKHHVTVISDEIHCDLTDPGRDYVPYASVSEECRSSCAVCFAPTKTFNLAGIQTAGVMVPDPFLRHKLWRALNTDEVAEPNVFAIPAAVAAYNGGDEWLDALRAYLYWNKQTARDFIRAELPRLTVVPGEATYLLWLDCRDYTDDSVALAREIRARTGLLLSNGSQYGRGGETFLRMNIACPRARVLDGLERLRRALA
ncbi:MAG: MalY/PatB family protein [Eubacteriales bacterium]|nr:MalY/PatB family protein [Eubacteriales bacterium]